MINLCDIAKALYLRNSAVRSGSTNISAIPDNSFLLKSIKTPFFNHLRYYMYNKELFLYVVSGNKNPHVNISKIIEIDKVGK